MPSNATRAGAITGHVIAAITVLIILWRFVLRDLFLPQSSRHRHRDGEGGRRKRRGCLASFFLGTYRPRKHRRHDHHAPPPRESALLENAFWEVLGRIAAWYHGIDRDSEPSLPRRSFESDYPSPPPEAHVSAFLYLKGGKGLNFVKIPRKRISRTQAAELMRS